MYFLAIVTNANIKAGIITPGYVLCKSKGTSPNRSGWRVTNLTNGDNKLNPPKLLVYSPTGHDEMIDFLSAFRTREHMHGDSNYDHEETKKYYPEGALFWFECNDYGDRTGPALFVKRVPDKEKAKKYGEVDQGFARLKENLAKIPDTKQLLVDDPQSVPLEGTDCKVVMPQKNTYTYRYRYSYDNWKRYKRLKKRKEKENGY